MNLLERIVKIIVTFVVFLFAQGLLAGSINTIFDLIPIRIERLFPVSDGKHRCTGGCGDTCTVDTTTTASNGDALVAASDGGKGTFPGVLASTTAASASADVSNLAYNDSI